MKTDESERKYLCACGCGQETERNRRGEYNRFVHGHNTKHSKATQPSNGGTQGRFQPGNTIGKGRAVGSRNNVTVAAENLIQVNIGRTNIYQSGKKALASNHVNILRVKGEDPYYVAFVMNSFIGRMQTDKLSAGSAQAELYPKDIAQFLIPFVDKGTQLKIRERIIASLALKKQSTALLETAKRAVEIAIEQDEPAALAYIEAHS